ncbi:ABC transporter substrate-binding protein [Niveispirillum sp.]|uniref:substrate-binding periplasmic protein n=1 Tax=Niveispirillum sp. TaxID=1917217 RepID=UPI001B4B7A02|nr:transporter substrate-binding domain-containing protein [Niveispirillum sp.]MBP7338748.1 transporter substrate-binding domain-containing protein [Niveispirillum sp.]
MRRLVGCFTAVGLVALSMAGFAVGAGAAEVKLRADGWCPYNCEPGNRPGYLIDIAKAALEPAGHTVDYQLMPWTEALAAAAAGTVTGAVGATREEAPTLVYATTPLGLSRPTLVIRKGKETKDFKVTNLDSLKGLRFGSIKDYFYATEVNAFIDANKGSANLVQVTGDNVTEDLVNMLIDGKLDAIVEDSNVVDYLLESKGYRNLFNYHALGEKATVSIGFSPKDPNSATYAKLIDAKLAELRKNGQLTAILEKYGMKDWQ